MFLNSRRRISYLLLNVPINRSSCTFCTKKLRKNIFYSVMFLCWTFFHPIYAPVKLFCPHPPGYPRGHHFLGGCPGLFITLFLPCATLINHFNPLILECLALFSLHFPVPRPFLSHKCFLWPRGCPGGIGAEQFDRRITGEIMYKNDTLIEYGRVRKGCGFRFPFQLF